MKSAILIKSKKPLVIANIELPKKLEFGQVLVNSCLTRRRGAALKVTGAGE